MIRFFASENHAASVAYSLQSLSVPFTQQCACLRDRGKEVCEGLNEQCPNGVYIEVPEKYAHTLNLLASIVKSGQ